MNSLDMLVQTKYAVVLPRKLRKRYYDISYAPVAQVDRAPASGAGCGRSSRPRGMKKGGISSGSYHRGHEAID